MSNQSNSASPVRLFGDDSATPGSGSTGISDLTVSKSGESILFTPRDATGAALPIASVGSFDDVQVLQVVGVTSASTCTLGFGGLTTAPIVMQPIPALTAFVYQATLPKPGSYDIALTWGSTWGLPPGVRGSTQTQIQVFGSGQQIGTVRIDQSQVPDPSTGIVALKVGIFQPVGTFVFAGTNLEIRLVGEPNTGPLMVGAVRVTPTGSTDPSQVGFIDPGPDHDKTLDGTLQGVSSTSSYGNWVQMPIYTTEGDWHVGYYATPTGTATSAFPNASDVEKALYSLANVVPGSLQVTSPNSGMILIHFSGPMGAQAWPTLACSEPAIRVSHDGTAGSLVGGNFPAVTINGTTHTLGGVSYAQGKPRMAFHLIQDATPVQYLRYGEGLYRDAGSYDVRYGVGYGGRVACPVQSGMLASWQFQGLAGPADFQIDITWPGGDSAADLLKCVVLDGANNMLATISGIDQSLAPIDTVDSGGVGWKSLGHFSLSQQVNALTIQAYGPGNPGKHVILDSVRMTRISPDRAVKILPSDLVLFHMPPSYVMTSSGAVPGGSNLLVASAPATRLPAIPQVSKSMQLGYNCDVPNYYGVDSCYSNLAAQIQQPIGLSQNASGNPNRLADDGSGQRGSASSIVCTIIPDAGGRGFGVPTYGPGSWVVQWTGSPYLNCRLDSLYTSTSITEDLSRRQTIGTVNRQFFQVTTLDASSPGFQLKIQSTQSNGDGTYACDISNVAIFPPGIDPDSPARWRQSLLSKLRGVKCFRFMDLMGTNHLNLSDFSHFPDPAKFPLGYAGRTISVPIASISPPTPDAFCDTSGGTVIRVTTKVPHGLVNGFVVGVRAADGSSLGQVTSTLIDQTGATTTTPSAVIDPTDGYQGQYNRNRCHVIDATTVQISISNYSSSNARMTNTLTPAQGLLYGDLAPYAMISPADIADLCTVAGLEPWICVPWLATDDCVTRLAQALAAGLPVGRVVHVEYGNEAWNWSFLAAGYCVQMAKLLGLPSDSYVSYYMTRMGQVHQIFRNVWTAAGRNPAEIRRVCGTLQVYAAGTTVPSLQFAIANGLSFDELAPASYYSNVPAAGPLDDLLTREQLLDLFAMNLQQSDLPGQLAAHLQACRDAFSKNPTLPWLGDVVLVNYEGGPDTMTTSTMTANIAAKNHAVHRHPDFCEIELNHLQMLEDVGVKLFNIFSLYGTRDVAQWGVYEGTDMAAGTGDATLDLANVADYENLRTIKSETAAALMKWSAMVQQPMPPASPVKKVLRNEQLLTYGGRIY